ncbi:LacI family DNA-binding transcriptional regulator [Streptococcus didelphis]|uniref:LacI family DNA-binding transcriptional regulator n=1 Tax=Streptococcus didelphis TaxID=102886 RepID=A0ABY9LI77_9STRE|nr:LacI family DNA-binding transcriptional regulator [Streptococcus didelphis]WMB28534.1 LacI family DNA-binding transcriptional regulator [Streptococcus didelphis]WMB29208.1 LacI family DNA-binding transcriptional regulator [Streptococcus didelphis]
MTSIRDIAKKSGVAPSTVSRYINHSGYVAHKTGEKIQATIDNLNYVPNQIARELSLGQTKRIGVVIPHTQHPFFIDIIRGLLDAALTSHYQVVMLPSHYDSSIEKSYLEQLRAKSLDGLIFTSRTLSLSLIESYHAYGRIVLLEDCQSPHLSSISINRRRGLNQLFTYIRDQELEGTCALLFTRNHYKSATYNATMTSCQQILGKDYPTISFGAISTFQDGYRIAENLSKHKSITSILANSDDIAAGIKHYYDQHNQKLPLLLSQEAQLSGKLLGIASIHNNSYQLGFQALELAISDNNHHQILNSHFLKSR